MFPHINLIINDFSLQQDVSSEHWQNFHNYDNEWTLNNKKGYLHVFSMDPHMYYFLDLQ